MRTTFKPPRQKNRAPERPDRNGDAQTTAFGDCLPPRRLYHYTNAAGFFGIVESGGCLRATHHGCLNDAGEVDFGFQIALGVLEELHPIRAATKRLAREYIHEVRANDFFLACFSRKANVLSQWRAYADNCAGYCIGFDPRSQGDDSIGHWWECLYGRRAVERGIRQGFAREMQLSEMAQYSASKQADQLSEVAWRFAQAAKHEHFIEEREWRLSMGNPDEDPQFHVGARGLTSYVSTGKLAIKEVWVGPAARPTVEVAIRMAEQHLAKNGVTARVSCWQSSFRP
jgi:hypothetical protein